jgi:mannitol/fructose-specific phosphotransferase system IIA component (Ntr-type)
MVYAVFVPLFFTRIGLGIDFFKNFNLFLVVFVSAVGIIGKFSGAWLGAIFSGLPKVNRLSVAIAHTPGGSMEIVIGTLALRYNLISETMFVAIVLGGLISSVILGPWLQYSIRRRKSVSILEFFSRREVIPSLKSGGRDNAIRELCLLAHEQGNMPSVEALEEAVLKRENSMGTAMEEGVAVPHARIPHLPHPVVVFGLSQAGIEWNSPDGKPSHFIFLILTPKEDDDIQVQILKILARAMSDKGAREAIMRCGNQSDLWQALQDIFTTHQVTRGKEHR